MGRVKHLQNTVESRANLVVYAFNRLFAIYRYDVSDASKEHIALLDGTMELEMSRVEVADFPTLFKSSLLESPLTLFGRHVDE